MQERLRFVTRAQDVQFKNNPLCSAAVRGVRFHPHPRLLGQPLYSALEVEMAEVIQAQKAQPLGVRKALSLVSSHLAPLLCWGVF